MSASLFIAQYIAGVNLIGVARRVRAAAADGQVVRPAITARRRGPIAATAREP